MCSVVEWLLGEADALVADIKVNIYRLEEDVTHDGEAHIALLDAAVTPWVVGGGCNGIVHEGAWNSEVAPVVGKAKVKIGQRLIAMKDVCVILLGEYGRAHIAVIVGNDVSWGKEE